MTAKIQTVQVEVLGMTPQEGQYGTQYEVALKYPFNNGRTSKGWIPADQVSAPMTGKIWCEIERNDEPWATEPGRDGSQPGSKAWHYNWKIKGFDISPPEAAPQGSGTAQGTPAAYVDPETARNARLAMMQATEQLGTGAEGEDLQRRAENLFGWLQGKCGIAPVTTSDAVSRQEQPVAAPGSTAEAFNDLQSPAPPADPPSDVNMNDTASLPW